MKAYKIDGLRAIKKSIGRFLSILLIVAIGAAFYAGFRTTGSDMRLTADQYYRDTNTMDVMVTCNFGFDDEDITFVQSGDGIKAVAPGLTADAFNADNGDNLHIMGLFDTENGMNRPQLVEGSFPTEPGEAVVDVNLAASYPIGSEFTLTLKDTSDGSTITDVLVEETYKVVGTVTSPLYIGGARGTSTLGSGLSDGFIMISPDDFKSSTYTELYVTFDLPSNATVFTSAYENEITSRSEELVQILNENKEQRFKRLTEGPQKVIEEGGVAVANANEVIANSETRLVSAQAAVDEATNMAVVDQTTLTEIQTAYQTAKTTLETQETKYNAAVEAKPTLEATISSLDTEISQLEITISDNEIYLNNLMKMKKAMGNDIDQDTEIRDLRDELDGLKTEKTTLEDSRTSNQTLLNDENQTIADSGPIIATQRQILATEQEKLTAAEDSAEKKEAALAEATETLNTVKTEIADAKTALEELSVEIEEAEAELENVGNVNYYMYERSINPSYKEYGQNADRVDVIAVIFPFFFILVAFLICLNTMTRLVEEESTLIGTYKALGYTNTQIRQKYIAYAGIAALVGAIIGLAIGFKLLPYAIMLAYGVLYNLPNPVTAIQPGLAILVIVVALACTVVPAFFVSEKELKKSPAELMRPKTPKMGKRILLERITPLWKALSFKWKVTLRNLSRYKTRVFMTILGIAGGTALMLAGLGFRNALSDVVNVQFNDLFHYGMIVSLDEDADEAQRMKLTALLNLSSTGSLYTYETSIGVTSGSNSDPVTVDMIVGEQANQMKFPEFVTLRNPETKASIEFNQDSVILTEKAAEMLGVQTGGNITLTDSVSHNEYSVEVTGVTENYAGHYLYMGESIYSKYFGQVPNYTSVMIKTASSYEGDNTLVAEAVNRLPFVRSCTLTSTLKQSYSDIVSGLNIIVYVFIVFAALLAFVVLYNLTIINISERTRELSTFKVLGFTNREVSGFISRENIILTIGGIIVGLIGGIYLCNFVVVTAEMNDVMFGREIKPLSFVISAAVILLFALIVNGLMKKRIRKINMVEALKSIE